MKTGRIKDGYGSIQRDVMICGISVYSKVVYCLLVSYAGDKRACYPSLKTMCDNLNISKPTVIKAIKELIAVGLLVADKNKTALGEHENNVYYPMYIMDERVVNDVNNPVKQVYQGSKSDLPPVVNDVDTKINISKINIEDDNFKNDLFGGFGFKEQKKKKEKSSDQKEKALLMREAPENDLNYFKEKVGEKYQVANLDFYHSKALNWSNAKGTKRIDWTATIRNFISSAVENNKLVKAGQEATLNGIQDTMENWDDI